MLNVHHLNFQDDHPDSPSNWKTSISLRRFCMYHYPLSMASLPCRPRPQIMIMIYLFEGMLVFQATHSCLASLHFLTSSFTVALDDPHSIHNCSVTQLESAALSFLAVSPLHHLDSLRRSILFSTNATLCQIHNR
jgi:hypothetical protein